MEKATDTGHVAQKINKLFYREILLEKATDTGHVAPKHGGRRSIAGIKESFKGNEARARLARGFRNKKISREISCKKFKTHLQFYVKISNKNFSSFFTGKSLHNFSKKVFRDYFSKTLSKRGFLKIL